MGLAVHKVRINRSQLQGIPSIQGVVHKAAAERLCREYHCSRLPEEPKAELRVYIEKDQVQVLLDLSGQPLFKRGYRTEGGIAPLRETTAAALLLSSNWRRKYPLYDPFCGSGTIVIEAAMYAWDMAPGLGRGFALSALTPADPAVEAQVREAFLEKVDFTRTIRIHGSDADPRMAAIAKSNALRAYQLARNLVPARGMSETFETSAMSQMSQMSQNLPGLPVFQTCALRDIRPPETEAGFILTNPPYGKRLGDVETAEATYREMADMGRNFPGWKLGLITNHPGFESHFGKKADSCRELTNGTIRSYFYQYEKL
jgi:putative N6-adenine-specific DNA methylase